MTIQERVLADLKDAMRAGDVERRDALRMLRAAILDEEILIQKRIADELAAQQAPADGEAVELPPVERRPLTDQEVLRVIERLARRHQDSIEQFERAGRADLVAREQAQLAVIQAYRPARLSREEVEARVRAVIAETGARTRADLGKVMPRLSAELRDRADMREVNRLVQDLLKS